MNEKIECATITYNGKNYKVEWEPNTKLVWVLDDKGYRSNYGNAKAKDISSVLDCAKEMLKTSGL